MAIRGGVLRNRTTLQSLQSSFYLHILSLAVSFLFSFSSVLLFTI
ncbi:hypothetical protein COLO4_24053 [Corchorus olitorius]|uniref:Uncharacterized protein n=1 Tax=Corchorus olitorius TaxID=93759 RepID=A0A1R3ID59_9ROSI|nr:hypothetical protein COLO4_24053 [Corchorus olitorius]